jgi:hypothetical protein
MEELNECLTKSMMEKEEGENNSSGEFGEI